MLKRYVLVYIILISVKLFPLESVIYPKYKDKISLTSYLEYFIDDSNELDINDLIIGTGNKYFRTSSKEVLNLGYTRSPIWIRIAIDLTDHQSEEGLILEIENELVQYIDVYYLDKLYNPVHFSSTGFSRGFDSKNVSCRTFAWDLSVLPKNETTIYLKLKSNSAKGLPIYLWNKIEYFKEENRFDQIILLTVGFLIALALYQILIGIVLKLSENIILGLLICSVLFITLNALGIVLEYWPFKNHTILLRLQVISYPIFAILFSMFSKNFTMRFNKKPYLFNFIYITNITLFILSIFLPFSAIGYLAISIFFFIIIEFIYIISSAVLRYKLGEKDSLFFILSFCPTMISFILRSLKNIELVNDGLISRYGALISFPITLLFFASAIIYRFNLIQKEADRQKKLLVENLEETNKMKDLFLSSTAHELRTPLNGIIGLSESVLIDGSQKLTEQSRINLNAVSSSAWRLSRMVNDILDHEKGKVDELHLDIKNINIGQLINVVVVNLSPLFRGKQVTLRNLNEINTIDVMGDENRIQQILYNLLDNAIKFTHKGEVSISTKIIHDEINICVKDSGIGITNANLKSIFSLYNQGGDEIIKKYGGTGIGLALSKKLVELQKGRIWAESKVDEGSSFFFTLPIAKKNDNHEFTSSLTEKNNHLLNTNYEPARNSFIWEDIKDGQQTILAVDDEPINLQVIENYLPKDKYLVYSMTSGVNLMETLNESVSLELIILDIFMPEISGYDLCSKIRKKYKSHELPILMLTASSNPEDMVQAFSSGANDYITKPVSRDELLARVETHIKLKKSIERNDFTNKKLNEIDRLISLGFMATSFVLKNKISVAQENIVLKKAYDYYKPIFDQLLRGDKDRSKLSNNISDHDYFERITQKLRSLEHTKITNFLIQIKESIYKTDDAVFKEHDIERVSSDIFDLIGCLLKIENPITDSEKSVLNDVGMFYGLTAKEIETTIYIYEGYSNQEICEKMGIALNTVKQHIYHIFNKVGVENRTHLIFQMLNK